MKPSMKVGVYNTYLLLNREGDLASIKLATCECAAGYVINMGGRSCQNKFYSTIDKILETFINIITTFINIAPTLINIEPIF